MATNYPGSLDTGTEQPSPLSTTEMDDAGFEHDVVHTNHSEAIIALETKVGVGSSTAVADSVLAGTGSGTSGWSTAPSLAGLTVDTDTLHVDATNDRVGIGTTSPNQTLDVDGALAVRNKMVTGQSTFTQEPWSGSTIALGGIGSIGTQGSFRTSLAWNYERGTDSGWHSLGINSYTSAAGINLGNDGITFLADSSYAATTLPTTRMILTPDGKVGIGTTSPGAELEVRGSSDPQIRLVSSDASDPAIYFGDSVDPVRAGFQYDLSADRLAFRGYDNSTRMAIDSSGNVGIGTSSPSTLLQINNGIVTSRSTAGGQTSVQTDKGIALIASSMNSSSKYTPGLLFGSTDPAFTTNNPKYNAGIFGVAAETYVADTDTAMQIEFLTSGTNGGTGHGVGLGTGFRMAPTSFYPLVDGGADLGGSSTSNRFDDVYATSGTVNTSDERDKTNITDLDFGLTFVDSLRPVSYTWADRNGYIGTRTHMGFVAQEVATALGDEAVNRGLWINSPSVPIDPEDPEGEQTDERQGLRYHQLIAPMVKAIQELSTRVTALEAA